jgi:mannose-6-phosphate isomerase-like protein (cupin superfamily)
MSYTIKNLKEVEDAAPRFGMAPGMEARFARRALETEQLGVSYERYAPNFRGPFGHRHSEQEEVYVVLGGSGRVKLDDDVVDLKQWDAVRVASTTMRNFEAGPEGLEVLAIGAPTTPEPDVDMVHDWWTD